jgi:hypothetical protein
MADGDPGERRRRAGGHPATVTPLCRSPRAAVPDWPSDHLRSKSPSRARARDAQTSTARSRARAHPPPSLESTSLGPGCAGPIAAACGLPSHARARDVVFRRHCEPSPSSGRDPYSHSLDSRTGRDLVAGGGAGSRTRASGTPVGRTELRPPEHCEHSRRAPTALARPGVDPIAAELDDMRRPPRPMRLAPTEPRARFAGQPARS